MNKPFLEPLSSARSKTTTIKKNKTWPLIFAFSVHYIAPMLKFGFRFYLEQLVGSFEQRKYHCHQNMWRRNTANVKRDHKKSGGRQQRSAELWFW